MNVAEFKKASPQQQIANIIPKPLGGDFQFAFQIDYDKDGYSLLRVSGMPYCVRSRDQKAYDNALSIAVSLNKLGEDVKKWIVENEIRQGITKEEVERDTASIASRFMLAGFSREGLEVPPKPIDDDLTILRKFEKLSFITVSVSKIEDEWVIDAQVAQNGILELYAKAKVLSDCMREVVTKYEALFGEMYQNLEK